MRAKSSRARRRTNSSKAARSPLWLLITSVWSVSVNALLRSLQGTILGRPQRAKCSCESMRNLLQGVAGKPRKGWDRAMIACMRLAWVAVLLACASGVRGADEAKRIKGRVLVDSVHAHNYLKPAEDAEAYSYHIAYGHRKAFGFLQQQGVSVEEIKSGRLDGAALAKCDVLYINLVSAELPPFYVSEIQAIKAFIETGGSLFVITDHTNCYYHTHKLAPLM